MRRFSVVVVASRGLEGSSRLDSLRECLISIARQTYPKDSYEVIVVDSGSGIGPPFFESFKSQSEVNITFVGIEKLNIGPAVGRNRGVLKSQFEFVVFTDDDSMVPSDWLEKINAGYESHPDASGVGGLTLPPPSLSQRSFLADFERKLYYKYLKHGELREYVSTSRDEHPVFGGNISYSRKVLMEVGLFDESFHSYIAGEDADLKERVLKKDGFFVFVPVVVSHHTSYTVNRFFRQQLSRGASILRFRRRHGQETYRLLIFVRILLSLLAYPFLLIREEFDFRFALVAWLSLVIRNIGKIYYYDKV